MYMTINSIDFFSFISESYNMISQGNIGKSILIKRACLFKNSQPDNGTFFFFYLKTVNLYQRSPAKKELGIFHEFIGTVCQPDLVFLC